MTRRFSAQALLLSAAAGACADLAPIEPGLCGNLIIEPGEDCDGDDARGVCRTPLSPGACHYDCTDTVCPPEFVCGTGRICLPADTCGNGVVETGEDCDGDSPLGVCRPADQAGACRFDCTTAQCPSGFRCLETGVCEDDNVCGNGIVEAENLEDCDGPGDYPCRPPGLGGCRYDCSESPDACPVGYGCGVDGICRRPSGEFFLGKTFLGETLALRLGDLDGDGRDDVVQVTLDGFEVHFLTSTGNIDDTAIVPAVPAPAVVGDLTGDGADDLAFRVPSKFVSGAGELAAFVASTERVLSPITQSSDNLPGVAVALDVLPPAHSDDLVVLNQDVAHGYSFEADLSAPGPAVFGVTELLHAALPSSSLLLGVASADFLRSTLAPCEELAMAWRNVSSLVVITPCREPVAPSAPPWNPQSIPPRIVQLPPGHRPWAAGSTGLNPGGAIYGADLNGDGSADLLAPTNATGLPACDLGGGCSNPDPSTCTCKGCVSDGNCGSDEDRVCPDCSGELDGNFPGSSCDVDGLCEPAGEGCGCPDCSAHPLCPGPDALQAAYGVADGSFHSSLPVPLGSGDDQTAALAFERLPNFLCPDQLGPLGSELLAVGDVNDDGRADLVTALGVYTTTPTGAFAYTFCPQERWIEVALADFDGNGTLDVVASSGTTTLDYVSGTGDGTFSSQALPVGGFPRSLVMADFDGDTLSDVAFLRTDLPGPAAGNVSDVMIAFGAPFAAPDPPEVVGRVRDAVRLTAGRLLFGDGTAELLVQRVSPGDNAALLRGSIARQLVSPLVLRSLPAPPFATHAEVLSLEGLVHGRFRSEHVMPPHRFPLAALSARFGAEHRVELVSFDGDELAQWHNAPFECAPPAGTCPLWRLAAVDLDGDGIDSVIAFRDGEVAVFVQDSLAEGRRSDTGVSLYVDVDGRGAVHEAAVGAPVVADVDADGLEDVALLSSTGDIHIYWNDGSGQFAIEDAAIVPSAAPPPRAAATRAFAFLHSGGDDALELATVSAQGVRIHSLDAASRTFSPPSLVEGAVGGDLIVGGDVSGDGVDDLVVGSALGFTLLPAKPVLP